jgi:phosphotriesterase-related protein
MPFSRRSGSSSSTSSEAEGADLSRVVIGHADSHPSFDYHLAIVERGATAEFDFLGMSFTPLERHGEERIVQSICALLARGHAERILLSQDVCHDSQLTRYGGNGYTYLAETFLPRLRMAGVSDDEIQTVTIHNPRRLLTIG